MNSGFEPSSALDQTRVSNVIDGILHEIVHLCENRQFRIMEVCGTHTMAVARYGLKTILPPQLKLLSGPGCPVCVTPNEYLDRAIALARKPEIIIATFGDMVRVPGTTSSLAVEKQNGADVRVLYSPLDALDIARENPGKSVVFLGVGFETTTPPVAGTIDQAMKSGIPNFFVLAGFKTIPHALKLLVEDPELKVDGFLCPGHVSAVTGFHPYQPLAGDHHIPCVISGFDRLDILQSLLGLVRQITEGRAEVENQYPMVVKPDGNPKARNIVAACFEACDSTWRGIGSIPGSGLKIRRSYRQFDAEVQIPVTVEPSVEHSACHCGSVLRGILEPSGCPLFRKTCSPETPVGPCMVSSEGSCAAAFRYS